MPWCLAPNGIRGERQHKGDKVKLRCCQLWLTTSGPDSSGTGALSRHRSHSPFTPLFFPHTHPPARPPPPSPTHFSLILLSFLLPPSPTLLPSPVNTLRCSNGGLDFLQGLFHLNQIKMETHCCCCLSSRRKFCSIATLNSTTEMLGSLQCG